MSAVSIKAETARGADERAAFASREAERIGPDFCPTCNSDTYLCQGCGRVFCASDGCGNPPVWQNGNRCPKCAGKAA